MVNDAFIPAGAAGAERRLILSYARPAARGGFAALLALDDVLASILRTTSDPMVGQMRLTWWHGALEALDTAPAPAHPVLRALGDGPIAGATLARVVEGWEVLLDPEPDLAVYAVGRGDVLFAAAGTILGAAPGDPVAAAGRGWALADLACHASDAGLAERAGVLARSDLREATGQWWSRAARPLGAMAHLAAVPADAGARRVGRALWHRLTGR